MIYIFLAEGFEEIETITTIDILRRCNLEVRTISICNSLTVYGAHNIPIICEELFSPTIEKDADALVLPGGMPGAKNLLEHKGLKQLLLSQHSKNGLIAAICAAPIVLGSYGILSNRKATCYPGFEDFLKGANLVSDMVVKDDHIITAIGPAAAITFGFEIAQAMTTKEVVTEVRRNMLFA